MVLTPPNLIMPHDWRFHRGCGSRRRSHSALAAADGAIWMNWMTLLRQEGDRAEAGPSVWSAKSRGHERVKGGKSAVPQFVPCAHG